MKTYIKTVERYVFDGKEYTSLAKVRQEVENRIGGVVDDFFNQHPEAPVKLRLALHEYLQKPQVRELLTGLLNIEFTVEDYATRTDETKNILDLRNN